GPARRPPLRVPPQRRQAAAAHPGRRGRSREGVRDGLQPQRLRGDPLGRPRGLGRAVELPPPCTGVPAPAHARVPKLVRHPQAPPALTAPRAERDQALLACLASDVPPSAYMSSIRSAYFSLT